ncbi:MAG: Capsular polysaccharide biosynthesis protein-like protein [Paucimonas sp.]|nr:Capsular polysaccharide biosynthesis protein-like protein [Paucimonas sp.]
MTVAPQQHDIDRLLTLYRAKDLEHLVDEAERLLTDFPDAAILHVFSAYGLIGLAQFDAGAAASRKALGLNPAYPDALNALGVALMNLGHYEESAARFEEALLHHPSNAAALTNLTTIQPRLGDIHARQGRLADAAACYRKFLAAYPQDVPALTNLANILLKQGRPSEANICLQKLLACDLEQAHILFIVRTLGRIGKLLATPLAVTRAAEVLILSDAKHFAEAAPERCLFAQPPVPVPGGTKVSNLSDMSERTTKTLPAVPAYLLKVADAECIWSNILLSGSTFIDANNGYGSLEMVGHTANDQAVRVTAAEGRLRFHVTEASSHADMTEPVGILAAATNYSSWVLGELPRVGFYKMLSPDMKIALHSAAQPFHLQSLALFGIAEHQVITVDKTSSIRGKELYYATPTFMHQNMSFESIALLRKQFFAAHDIGNDAARSLYVSRSKLGAIHDRRIRNELEVEAFLAAHGFEILHPQELSFLEQARAFASARRIVSPFGAALANAAFCRKDVRPCILRTKHTPEFDRLFQWLGVDVCHVTPERQKVRSATFQSQAYEFNVDLDDLQRFVTATS